MTTYISSLFHAVLFRFPVRKLKPKTTSLRIYKMWSTMFLPSELTEILGNSSRIQFIKTQQNCSSSMDFESFFWCTLCHLLIIGNQRRYSSRLSIPIFIGTPCMIDVCKICLIVDVSLWCDMPTTNVPGQPGYVMKFILRLSWECLEFKLLCKIALIYNI